MSKNQGRFSELDDPAFEGIRFDVDPAEFRDSKEEIGKGTYGTVYKVKLRGSVQAAKEFHLNFTIKGKNAKERKDVLTKFSRCAGLRHNNIVEVFGIYENKTIRPTAMVLIMELMDCSLSSLLDCKPEISNSTKLSILLDVSSGLKYLHSQDPPIAHYYLSSSNVLLTAERKAKISDVGAAQLVVYVSEKKASQKAQGFMAPEIKKSKATFDLSADVFSYGVVMLHTITQKQLTVMAPAQQNKQLQFDYRSQFDKVVADPFFNQLKELVRSCTLSDPNRRPQIALVSQVIEIMIKPPESLVTSCDDTKSLAANRGHDEVQQTIALEQAQPTISSTDVRSINLDFGVAKPVPTLPYALENRSPKVVGFNNLGNTCFFNSMLQCIHQTVDLHYAIAKGKRVYPIENSIEGFLPVEVTKPSHGLAAALQGFFNRVNQHNGVVSPYNLLQAIGRNNYRFGRGTQEDSHEVLRCLLSGLREEEINCIKQGVYSHYNVSQNFLKDKNIDGETKLSIKEYLSKVSKGVCDIDCTVGVEIMTTTVCHQCQTPLQLKEFCLDLALPMPQAFQMNDGTYGSIVTSKEKFNKHLKNKGLHYHNPLPSAKFETQLEHSLWAFTKLDVLDDKNKFICHSCSNAQNFQITQCRVSKQILIHKLSPVLILQMKRFTIGSHNVTKDNQHVSFPRVLNMAPYCTTECLEDFADSKGKILYGLYGVVVHGGSLHGGHYTACVRQRPIQKNLSKQPDVGQQTYDEKAAEDGQWYYTSDSHVSTSGFDAVKGCQAYLLFYEMLPGNEWLREVKRIRKATKDQNETNDEVLELTNQIKDSIKDKMAGLDRVQTKIEEILQTTKEYRKSYEETLQDVEHLQTKHLQKVKQLEEDQTSQAIKFALELKDSHDKVEELKDGLKRNAAINKEKVKQLEEQSNTITQQKTKMEELKVTLKEKEDSMQAAERENQQTLEQHKQEKKALQDTITVQNKALQKSEESKQATEEKYQQLLEELEHYKKLQRQDVQNNHNADQPKCVKQQMDDGPQEDDDQLRNGKQQENGVHQGNTEQQEIIDKREDGEQQQTDKVQENKKQQIHNEQQSNDEQQGNIEKESTMTVQQQKAQPDQIIEDETTDHDSRHQQSLEEQKASEQQLPASINEDKTLLDQNREPVKTSHDDSQPDEETNPTLDQQKELQRQGAQNNHHAKCGKQQMGDGPQEDDDQLRNGKQQENGVHQGKTEQEEINDKQEDAEQQQTDKLQQQIHNEQQSNDEQQVNIEKESTVTVQQQKAQPDQTTEESDDQQQAVDQDGRHQQSLEQQKKQDEQDNHNHCDSQPVNDEQQKNEDEIQKNSEQQHSDKPQEDGEQQSSSEQQGSMEDNNQQETDNLVANNDAEKQEESQQSNIDLSQQNQQIDGDNCIEIKAMKVVSDNAHKENGATREESYHKMGDMEKKNQELAIATQQHQPGQIIEGGNQQHATDNDGRHQQSLEQQKASEQQLPASVNEDKPLLDQNGEPVKTSHDDSQPDEETNPTLDQQKELQRQDVQNNHNAKCSKQQMGDGPQEDDDHLRNGKQQENSVHQGKTKQEEINNKQENAEQQQTDKLQQQIHNEQQSNDEQQVNIEKESTVTVQQQKTQPDQITEESVDQQQSTEQDGRHQPSLKHQKKQDEQDNHNHCGSQPVNDEQQKNEDEIQKNSEQQHSDKPQEDGEQQSSSEQQGSMEDNNKQETDNLVAGNDAEKQEENQQSNVDLSQQNQQTDGDNCTKIKAVKDVSDNAHKENGAKSKESYHKMGDMEKKSEELAITTQQDQSGQIIEGGNQQHATDNNGRHQQSLEQQKKKDEKNNHSQCGSLPATVNDEKQKNHDESHKSSKQQSNKPQEDDKQESSCYSDRQGNNDQQIDDNEGTDNLAKNDPEKQKENQQNNNNQSRKDLENRQVDGDNCTKIKVKKADSENTQKENDTTGED